MNEVNIYLQQLNIENKEQVKEKIKNLDTDQWKQEVEAKSTLEIYKRYKETIKEEQCYDNRPSSIICMVQQGQNKLFTTV